MDRRAFIGACAGAVLAPVACPDPCVNPDLSAINTAFKELAGCGVTGVWTSKVSFTIPPGMTFYQENGKVLAEPLTRVVTFGQECRENRIRVNGKPLGEE